MSLRTSNRRSTRHISLLLLGTRICVDALSRMWCFEGLIAYWGFPVCDSCDSREQFDLSVREREVTA